MREAENHHENATVTIVGKIQQWMLKLVGGTLKSTFYSSSCYEVLRVVICIETESAMMITGTRVLV